VRRRLSDRTIRLRMTALFGLLFLASGAGVLAITYLLVLNAVSPHQAPPGPPFASGTTSGFGGDGNAPGGSQSSDLATVLRSLFWNSWIALGIMAVISIALGWIVAGRMLRPIRTITGAVRDISANSLDRRLALDGPDDELKELGDTFDDLLDRLEASFRAQRQFVANASHELRTPLARQRVLGQVALADPDATADSLRETHERILVTGAQQERLIEALLTLSRGQAGIEAREPVDLARLAEEALLAGEAGAAARGVEVRAEVCPATVAGHRNLTERLVTNLVDNALKHNMPGGWIEVSTHLVDGHPTLVVSNTGPVVPAAAVDELYQPFVRFGGSRVGTAEGLGLGLSIVRAVADAHTAGIVTVARPEGGLTIRVTFPGERKS
jgi:signal transduction histidine kinase